MEAGADRAPCLLCGATGGDVAVVGYDRCFARADDYTYWRCRGCGLVALDPLPSAPEIEAFYPPAYYGWLDGPARNLDKRINRLAIRFYYGVESRGRSRMLRRVFSALSGRILSGLMTPWGGNRLLDIGCATGTVLDTYRRLGWRVAGIDQSAEAVALARARGLPVHCGDVFSAPFGPDFDVVLLNHFIEHVRDPIAVLARCATFVAPGGKIVMLTPNVRSLGFRWFGSCWYPLEAPRHLVLFDRHTLALLAHRVELAPIRIITRSDPTLLSYSHHYAQTQGSVLPSNFAARQASVGATMPHVNHLYRDLIRLPSWIAARVGWGEIIEAELRPSSGVSAR
jgi:2-polyprenyl-3-methyl-5-hydroxy-6-metoxy-1,4-benzoquinol methylase